MKKIPLLLAFGAGYVVGARAGRERYEQIKSGAQKVADNPRVQSATETVRSRAGDVASSAADSAKEKVEDAVEAAKHKAQRDTSVSPAP
jgi:hypothetical protein